MQHVLTFTLAFFIVYALVPVMRAIALRTGFVDIPNQRKIHRDPIPLLGGAAMFVGFFVTTMLMGEVDREYIGLALGALVIFVIGLVDDYAKTRGKDFPALPKFIGQLLAASILIYFGIRIEGITIPFGGGAGYYQFDYWLSVIGTILWVVGITNMFNFLDGVDGLAGGIAAISATTLLFISILKGQTDSAMFATTLIAISLAFLRHNFHPARIFMGDSGATFLGFTLAAIAVEGAFKAATLVSVAVPVLALGVPIFDFFYVTIRRLKENRPLHKADKAHTFHQLMRSGMTQIQAVAFLYLLGICFSLASIIVVLVNR
ncbi:MraY family glycosyltransferase [Effusibacillus pohliae]|uniref:MraY family glycosyltransferase n=1 Tax=Effusibacillus pohliae TaxID=232270 RepID=UPI00035D8E71|nr:MraY family glycosyltransferase [Effusibacillus pohliae]